MLAWWQYPDRIHEVGAGVIAGTDGAVLVEWVFGQATDFAWVWRDALTLATVACADRSRE